MRCLTLVLATSVLAFSGCSRDVDENGLSGGPSMPEQTAQPAEAPPEPPPPQHRAQLEPTKGNEATGEVTFTLRDGVVHLSGQVRNLKPNSEHGFHIHETGDCSAPDAKSAGDHFNPTRQPHGKPGADGHHLGDLVAIRSDQNGVANVSGQVFNATMGDGSPTDIVGKALIVHADPDDYKTQPSGNAGARIACGVIQ